MVVPAVEKPEQGDDRHALDDLPFGVVIAQLIEMLARRQVGLKRGVPRQSERAPFLVGEEWTGLELPHRGDLVGIHPALAGVHGLMCLAIEATGGLARYDRDQRLQLDG